MTDEELKFQKALGTIPLWKRLELGGRWRRPSCIHSHSLNLCHYYNPTLPGAKDIKVKVCGRQRGRGLYD